MTLSAAYLYSLLHGNRQLSQLTSTALPDVSYQEEGQRGCQKKYILNSLSNVEITL